MRLGFIKHEKDLYLFPSHIDPKKFLKNNELSVEGIIDAGFVAIQDNCPLPAIAIERDFTAFSGSGKIFGG